MAEPVALLATLCGTASRACERDHSYLAAPVVAVLSGERGRASTRPGWWATQEDPRSSQARSLERTRKSDRGRPLVGQTVCVVIALMRWHVSYSGLCARVNPKRAPPPSRARARACTVPRLPRLAQAPTREGKSRERPIEHQGAMLQRQRCTPPAARFQKKKKKNHQTKTSVSRARSAARGGHARAGAAWPAARPAGCRSRRRHFHHHQPPPRQRAAR